MISRLFPEIAESIYQPVLKRLEEQQQGKQYSADEVRDLVDVCELMADTLEKCNNKIGNYLNQGMDKRSLTWLVDMDLSMSNILNTVISKCRAAVAGDALPFEEKPEKLRRLDEYFRKAEKVDHDLRSLHAWLQETRPADGAIAATGQFSSDAAEYRDIESILADQALRENE